MKRSSKILLLFLLTFGVVAAIPHQVRNSLLNWGDGVSSSVTNNYDVSGTDSSMVYDGTDFSFGNSVDVTGSVSASGNISGVDGNFTGNVGGIVGAFTGAVSGTTGTFTGAGSFGSTPLTFGTGAAADQSFIFDIGAGAGNPFFKYDNAQGALVFSSDGVLEKKIGSGSGSGGSGGVNILLNSSCEDGLGNWTNSGGTLTQESYTDAVEGDLKYCRFVASAAGQYVETDLTTFAENLSGGGMADFKYLGGEGFTFEVIDENPNVISSQDIFNTDSWAKVPTATFEIPVSGKIRITSSVSETIDIDSAYLGSNKGFIVSDTFLTTAARIENDGSASIISQSSNSVDNVSRSGTGLTQVNFTTGEYTVPPSVVASIDFDNSAVKGIIVLEVTTTFARIQTKNDNTSTNVDSAYNLSITKQGVDAANSSQEAYTPEQADFFIDVSIGGDNATVPNTSGTPEPFNGTSFDMVLNNGSAKIPCSSTNPSTGLTCLVGSEHIGIVFHAPRSGKYKLCLAAAIGTGGTEGERWMQTENNSQVVLQKGFGFSGGTSGQGSVRSCSTFNIDSIGEKTFRYFGDANSTTTIVADRSTLYFERDINITVEMVGHNVSRPIIQNMVDTSLSSGVTVESCSVDASSGTPLFAEDTVTCSSWIDTISDLAVGTHRLNFNTGVFSGTPNCVCVAGNNVQSCNGQGLGEQDTTKFAWALYSTTSVTVIDGLVHIICTGRR